MVTEPQWRTALFDFARVALRTSDPAEVLASACRTLRPLLDADWVEATLGDGATVALDGERTATPATLRLALDPAGTVLTAGWSERDTAPSIDPELQAGAVEVIAEALVRARHDTELAGRVERLSEAQELARLGSYDWNILTDTNDWSDELYRIYGHEPGSFNASYEKFLSLVHPDDREMIIGVHTKALEGEDVYRMVERIIRPDGEMRYLDSSGKVVRDETGRPVRMAGICLDITDQRRAADALRASEERFRVLVDAAPDAVFVVDRVGTLLQANRETAALFDRDLDDLMGRPATTLLPDWDAHVASATSADGLLGPIETTAVTAAGEAVPVDVSVAAIALDHDAAWAAFVRDARPRLRAAEADRRLTQLAERRRQAFEINDNVVQGLATTYYALQAGLVEQATAAVSATLEAASSMMGDLLDEQLNPHDLVRAAPAPSHLHLAALTPAAAGPSRLRVLLVDDSEDLRVLYRYLLDSIGADVVGEAGSGEHALEIAADLAPDVALVDLAMPGIDGFQTTTALKQLLPGCRVAVLSAFDEATAAAGALAAGADRYLVKGVDATGLAQALAELVPTWRRN